MKFASIACAQEIFNGTVEMYTNTQGTIQAKRPGGGSNVNGFKFYVRTEAAMNALLIKSLDKRFALPLMNIDRFTDQWAKLQEIA